MESFARNCNGYIMCICQSYGKSGVPHPSGRCMVCGEIVDMNGPHTTPPDVPDTCSLCGDQIPLLLLPKCHLTAPLQVSIEGDILILRCYVPECGQEVARFQVVRSIPEA